MGKTLRVRRSSKSRQYVPRIRLELTSPNLRQGSPRLPCLHTQGRSHQKIRSQHLPSMLPREGRRYWICQAPLKYHNGTEPCDRFVRKGSGIGLGLHSWHGVWDGRSDLSLEGISEGWKDSIKLDGLPDDGLFFDAKVSF